MNENTHEFFEENESARKRDFIYKLTVDIIDHRVVLRKIDRVFMSTLNCAKNTKG
jgi:hypothetical protein